MMIETMAMMDSPCNKGLTPPMKNDILWLRYAQLDF